MSEDDRTGEILGRAAAFYASVLRESATHVAPDAVAEETVQALGQLLPLDIADLGKSGAREVMCDLRAGG